jgi:hypothetical protein
MEEKMIQINLNPFLLEDINRRHEELSHEVAQMRLADDAFRARISGPKKPSRVLAMIGKELVSLGSRLEGSTTSITQPTHPMSQPDHTEGCS